MKRDDEACDRLARMRELAGRVSPQDKDRLELDMKLWEAGIKGEQQLVYELENSHLPITVLQGLRLESEGLSAQIDFFVIAPYVNLIVECKNLVGNITITSKGDFIREMQVGRRRCREGIYSPITQCERHAELMKEIRGRCKSPLMRFFHDLWYEDRNRTIVVLANPKTILDDASAPPEIRERIIRADSLVRYIKDLNARSKGNGKLDQHDREALARFWLDNHVERTEDLASRYSLVASGDAATEPKAPCDAEDESAATSSIVATAEEPACPKCGSPMVKRIAKKGERAGREFWGCVRYPKCRGLIDIDR